MSEKSRPIRPEFYFGRHLELVGQATIAIAERDSAGRRALYYGSKPDNPPYTSPSSDAFRFNSLKDNLSEKVMNLERERDANLWRAEKDYEVNTGAYQAQARAEFYEHQFDIIFLRNATRLALEHIRPKQCDCTPMRSAMSSLVRAAVKSGQPVNKTLRQFQQVFDGSCRGQVPTEAVGGDGCNPGRECGHELGKRAVGMMWKDGLTSKPEHSGSRVN